MNDGSKPSGSADVTGARLRYVIEGSGIPAVVVGSAVYYPRTFSRRLRERFRLVFIDARHFAEDTGALSDDVISLDTYTDDIEKVCAQLGLESTVVIGHSHHGNLALEYAKRYPARVSHLVLIGSPPIDAGRTLAAAEAYWQSYAPEGRKAALRDNCNALGSTNGMTPEEAYIAQYVAEGPKYWYDASYDASFLWRGVPVDMDMIRRFRGFFSDDYTLGWDPEQFKAPVLVVMGRHDYAVPHTLWDEVRPQLRNLTFRLFEHSGHTPQLEEPERFDEVLLEWVRKEASAQAV